MTKAACSGVLTSSISTILLRNKVTCRLLLPQSYYVAEEGLGILNLLVLLPKCWDCHVCHHGQ